MARPIKLSSETEKVIARPAGSMSFLKHIDFTQRGDTLILRQYQ